MPSFPLVKLRNSYTMICPPVHGDNLRALASGLSHVQVDNHDVTILYHFAYYEIFRAKVGMIDWSYHILHFDQF